MGRLVLFLVAALVAAACSSSGLTVEQTSSTPGATATDPSPSAEPATPVAEADPTPATDQTDAAGTNEPTESDGGSPALTSTMMLQRGLNLAGDFEVEPRGAWGTAIEADFFDTVAAAGFDHVRVPIRWSAHNGPAPTFTIDETFFVEVDWLLDNAERVGLTIIIDVHHFEALDIDPLANRDEVLALWDQIATRYADRPPSVVFELVNEPHNGFDDDPQLWNDLLADALAVVRVTNPDRLVVIGPVGYNHPSQLSSLELPDDPNLMVTVHTYDPTSFTLQGAVFVDPPPPTGQTWAAERTTLHPDWFDRSWDSTNTWGLDGVEVAFDRQFAAFAAGVSPAGLEFDSVFIGLAESSLPPDFSAAVLCNVEEGPAATADLEVAGTVSDPRPDTAYFEARFLGCGPVTDLALQVTSEDPGSIIIRSIDACAGDVCAPLLVTAGDAHRVQLEAAALWAEEQGVALHLGEFGVYDLNEATIDPASRAAWVASMRSAAEAFDIAWTYFEFSGEFGAYDHDNDQWHTDVLAALGIAT